MMDDLGAFNRYLGISVLLLAATRPVTAVIGRRYGKAAGRRFSRTMVTVLAAQQALVGLAVGRRRGRPPRRHRLTLIDLMTLSRGWVAAILPGLLASGIRDRRGVAGWIGWLALLYGAIVCDWLDGPIARRVGTSDLGVLLDREADSWLTLCAAAGAVGWGGLSMGVVLAPLVQYALMVDALRTTPYPEVYANEPGWVRHLGIVQMVLFIAALAPFRGRATSSLVRPTARLQTPLQLCGLILLRQRRRRA